MLVSLVVIAVYLDQLKDHINLTIGLISITLFGFQFLINNLQTLPSDYFHGKNVGTVSGMGGATAVAGTFITTLIVPIITKQSYLWFFILGAIMVPLAWLCISFITSQSTNKKQPA
jgi:ACS family hexuronate transporter-like MFS transporter